MEKILVDKTTEFYGWIASFLTALLFLNPIKSFIKLIKGKIEFQNSPAFLVTVCYISNICWYVYGEKISSKPLKCCNLFGMIVNFILIFIYLFFEIRVYTIDAILNCLIVIIGTYELYKSFDIIFDDDESIGNLCMGTQFMILLYPLKLIIRAVYQKNYTLIPIVFVCIFLSAKISWIYYGVNLLNVNIIYPNIVGFVLGITSIIVYLVYKGKYKILKDSEPSEAIEIEDNENKKNTIEMIKIEDNPKNEKEELKSVEIDNSKKDN